MDRAIALALLLLVSGGTALAQSVPDSEDGKMFFVLGATMGENVQAQFHFRPEEVEWVVDGLRASLQGRDTGLDPNAYQARLQELLNQRGKEATAAEKLAGEKFVERAAAQAGAVRTDSGLVITEIRAGDGEAPAATDKVRVHYHGTLSDGSVFDSSVDRGTPAEFPLNRVIKCWTEGLQRMRVGGKSTLVCPPELAYGDRGAPPKIPGGAALQFEVELLEIVK